MGSSSKGVPGGEMVAVVEEEETPESGLELGPAYSSTSTSELDESDKVSVW
jgi:hypothetical protein